MLDLRWDTFRSISSTLFRDCSTVRVPRVSLTEAGEDEVRDGEWGLRGGEWGLGTGRVGDWCTLVVELEWEFLEGE